MPALVDMIQPPQGNDSQFKRAHDFWDNAESYAAQSMPYGLERMQALDTMAQQIRTGIQYLPPDQQANINSKLYQALMAPVDNDSQQEYEAAWEKLMTVSNQLQQQTGPSMPNMQMMAMGMRPNGNQYDTQMDIGQVGQG